MLCRESDPMVMRFHYEIKLLEALICDRGLDALKQYVEFVNDLQQAMRFFFCSILCVCVCMCPPLQRRKYKS